jgi:hypothetical protein
VTVDVSTVIKDLPQIVASVGKADRQQLALVMTGCLASLAAGMATEREQAERAALERAAAETAPVNVSADDELLAPDDALALLGLPPTKRDWILEATRGQKFRVKLNRKTVLFERPGLVKWFRSKRGTFDAGRS